MKLRMQMRYFRDGALWAKALILCGMAVGAVWGCTPADRPTKAKDMPPQDTVYAKFIEYQVGDGEVSTVSDDAKTIPFILGEEFLPSRHPDLQLDYNYLHLGDGTNVDGTLNPNQSFFYRDFNLLVGGYFRGQRGASDHPEALAVDNQLKLFFTNQPFTIPVSHTFPIPGGWSKGEMNFDDDEIPNTTSDPPLFMDLNSYMTLGFQHEQDGNTTDVDVLAFQITRANTIVHFRTAGRQYNLARSVSLLLTVLDGTTVLAQSHAGFDFYTFEDAEVAYFFTIPGTYFLMLEDRNRIFNPGQFPADLATYDSNFKIYLFCESITTAFPDEAFIRRGDLQPSRSGNSNLDGGKTFEPDDKKTVIQDVFPDCDGIAGTGDEGDWGVNEKCGDFVGDNGVQDGNMQYWEIDDKENLDDGEYWTAKETNVRSFGQEAPSLIVAPGGKKLWMWINAGDAIYQLESLDGLEGLNWDLSNLFQRRPAIQAGGNGDSDSPVVASGVYGYCETRADNSDLQLVDLCLVEGNPVGCKGYPRTVAVTFGEDSVLDTPPQSDVLDPGRNVITSGPDGIINTFFLPSHLNYRKPFHTVEVTVPAGGPANPDVMCADSVSGANDDNAYLLGDDVWAPGLTVTPAEYWRNHNCVFFQLGDEFNRCAMGIPDTIAVRPGGDGRLDTIVQILKDKGDDRLCHAGPKEGICPGPDGTFSWEDLYLPLRGDDELCIQTDPVLGSEEVAICPGPGPGSVLETVVIDTFINITEISTIGGMPPAQCCACVDPSEVDLDCPVSGCASLCGDVCCDPLEVAPACTAICPGADHQLQSLWTLYFTDISLYKSPLVGLPVVFGKTDLFNDFDDEMCVLGGQIAICPGQNGYFQSYPLSRRFVVEEYDDYEDLLANYSGAPNDCYSLEVQKKQDSFGETVEKIFTVYRNEGVMFDDEIHWDPVQQEYYISTGANGINQTCSVSVDQQLIPHLRGSADQPIILPGPNRVLDTIALADELEVIPITDDRPLRKINSGADGISNSFALGDDRVEIYLGTGKPDWPCVLAGGDGRADTQAEGNDTQLFRPDEVTGFDAYQVGYPDVAREGDQLYLFYTGLGWAQIPPSWRPDRGSFAKLGECDRAGMDKLWGNNEVLYEADWGTAPPFISTTIYERTLVDKDGNPRYGFLHALDNNQGVLLAPRVGVATSTIQRIQADPTDWDKRIKPVIEVARFCAKSSEMPLDLGLDLPPANNPPHYNGAFSSDTYIYHEQSDGQPIFVMLFSGMYSNTNKEGVSDDELGTHESFAYNVGMARSLDARQWDVAYDLGNLVVNLQNAVDSMLSGGVPEDKYRNPTLAKGQGDSYEMFFNRFETFIGDVKEGMTKSKPGAEYGPDKRAWIGFAVRRGQVPAGACFDVAGSASLQEQNQRGMILSVIVIAIPLLIGIGWRLFRKETFSP